MKYPIHILEVAEREALNGMIQNAAAGCGDWMEDCSYKAAQCHRAVEILKAAEKAIERSIILNETRD